MKKKDEKILELQYTIEALTDEISNLEEIKKADHEKLWTIIKENDRLTLTYEPYRPPGDEHEGLDFYSLVEENESLTQNILDKMAVIGEQDRRIAEFIRDNRELRDQIWELQRTLQVNSIPKIKKLRTRNDRFWNVSVELWPGSWGLNYYRYDWRRAQASGHPGTSREGNFQIGPFGFSWNRDPKH